jgi:lipopolysaccharide transport system ATP-binding protein
MSQASISDIPTTSTADQEVLVKVEGVSKKFCRSLKKSLWYGVCDIAGELNPFTKHGARGTECGEGSAEAGSNHFVTSYSSPATSDGLRPGEFWAVNDVSFELRRGECLGLIGHNGAGKTTLLKMLNGLIKPDMGRIEINGRVGALIALGAGFNPVLTGRENIYINGSVLGLSKKEIDKKLDEIIDFSGVGEFIDSPVQNYSSGMQVRLGFSIAVVLIKPDVLLLDEILAVGDTRFVVKCLNAVRRLLGSSAVVFVSHQMQHVSSFCTRAALMDKGRCVLKTANIPQAIDAYCSRIETEVLDTGSGGVVLHRFGFGAEGHGRESKEFTLKQGERALLNLDMEVMAGVSRVQVKLFIRNEALSLVMSFPLSDKDGAAAQFGPGRHAITVDLGAMELNIGRYHFVAAISDAATGEILKRSYGLQPFRVIGTQYHGSYLVRPACFIKQTQ